ncbi:hypothetical protein F5880DRAFT_1508295 [Lentinula raphanica]|nr:hypothetical protein F5880DRAFT_1508295 [Lentinula raphanica]
MSKLRSINIADILTHRESPEPRKFKFWPTRQPCKDEELSPSRSSAEPNIPLEAVVQTHSRSRSTTSFISSVNYEAIRTAFAKQKSIQGYLDRNLARSVANRTEEHMKVRWVLLLSTTLWLLWVEIRKLSTIIRTHPVQSLERWGQLRTVMKIIDEVVVGLKRASLPPKLKPIPLATSIPFINVEPTASASTGSSAFFWSSLLRFVFFACFHNDDENANGSDNAAKHTKHSLGRHRGLLLVEASNLDRGHRSRGGKEIETVGTTMGGLGGISGHPQPSGTRSSSTVNTTSTTSTSTEAPPNSTSLMNTTKPPHPLLPAHHQPLPNFLLPGWTFNVQEEEDSTTSGGGEAEATSSVVKANKGMIDMILRLPVDKSVDKIRYLQQLVTVQGARSMELERREECVLVEEKEESLVVLPLLNVLVRDVPLFLVVRARARTKKFNQVEFGGGFCEQFLVVEAEEDEEKKEGVDAEPVLSALALDQNTPSPTSAKPQVLGMTTLREEENLSGVDERAKVRNIAGLRVSFLNGTSSRHKLGNILAIASNWSLDSSQSDAGTRTTHEED